MKILSFLLTLSFSLYSSEPKNNEFKFDEVAYGTGYGYFESYGLDRTGNSENYDVHLMSVPKEEMTNKFDYILLDLNSDNSGNVSTGVYKFLASDNKAIQNFTFNSASVLINYDVNTYSGDVYFAIDGTVEVKKKKDTYTLSYDLLLENGKVVTGNYEGSLKDWN
ncbi:MAG: hypothetical protein AAF149_10915 [Bacteroidota bacterium]